MRSLSVSTSYDDIKFKHILLPIWISAYIYKNKVYRFMINEQTGEVDGESPVSIIKIMDTHEIYTSRLNYRTMLQYVHMCIKIIARR